MKIQNFAPARNLQFYGFRASPTPAAVFAIEQPELGGVALLDLLRVPLRWMPYSEYARRRALQALEGGA